MRTFEGILPRTLLPRVLPDSACSLPAFASPDYLPIAEYNRPLTATFFALGTVLCTVLAFSLMICCAARLAGRIHGRRRKKRVRDGQRLTPGSGRMVRGLEVLRRGEGKGGKKGNVDNNGGCEDGERSVGDLEKEGEEGGGWSEWDVSKDEELPEYDAAGFNEKGEMIDAPCPAYIPTVKPVGNVPHGGCGDMSMKEVSGERILWRWCRGRRG